MKGCLLLWLSVKSGHEFYGNTGKQGWPMACLTERLRHDCCRHWCAGWPPVHLAAGPGCNGSGLTFGQGRLPAWLAVRSRYRYYGYFNVEVWPQGRAVIERFQCQPSVPIESGRAGEATWEEL